MMYAGLEGKEFHCSIAGYTRTRIFELPGVDLLLDGAAPHHEIYDVPPIRACLVSNLSVYFENSTHNQHYSTSPSLRHDVEETVKKTMLSQEGRAPVFLVVEEFNKLPPLPMVKGECCISDEVIEREGEKVPILVGGREGKEFITAWATIDGAWPQLLNNEPRVNMVLAAVRVGQDTAVPIRKHLDQNGLVDHQACIDG